MLLRRGDVAGVVARDIGSGVFCWFSFGLLGGVGGAAAAPVDNVSVERFALRYDKVGMLLAEKTLFQISGRLGALRDVGLWEGAGEGGHRVKVRE